MFPVVLLLWVLSPLDLRRLRSGDGWRLLRSICATRSPSHRCDKLEIIGHKLLRTFSIPFLGLSSSFSLHLVGPCLKTVIKSNEIIDRQSVRTTVKEAFARSFPRISSEVAAISKNHSLESFSLVSFGSSGGMDLGL